jgi:Fe-S cluster assembly ATPase SufC
MSRCERLTEELELQADVAGRKVEAKFSDTEKQAVEDLNVADVL